MTRARGAETNLVAYRRYQTAAGMLFWLPAIVLHLIDLVGLADALRLQAVYYIAVVVFEVPSGWLSDRFGRVITMRIAAVAWVAAHAVFLSSSSIGALVAGQILLALGYACVSGTDSNLHLDSLEAIGRADEFAEREAAVRRRMLISMAVASLLGGLLGTLDLRLVFAASLVAASIQFAFATRMVEPPIDRSQEFSRSHRPPGELSPVASAFGTGVIGWLALCVVAQVTIVHLAAELTPPYLAELVDGVGGAASAGVLPAGIVAAAVAAAGALVVGLVPRLADRMGVPGALVATGVVPVAIVVAMATFESWWLAPLLVFRGTQGAAVSVLAPRVVASHVVSRHRATVLSVMSLGGRLAYGGALLAIGAITGDTGEALRISAIVAVAAWMAVAATQRLVPRPQRDLAHGHHHVHEPIEHDHLHRHDDGHHDHDHPGHDHDDLDLSDGPVVHAHPHRHDRVEHSHPHTSDVHHRHEH